MPMRNAAPDLLPPPPLPPPLPPPPPAAEPPPAAAASRQSPAPTRSSSPSTEPEPPPSAPTAQKRRNNNNHADKPPLQKRPRRNTWDELFRSACCILKERNPQQIHFSLQQITNVLNTEWATLAAKDKKLKSWKAQFQRTLRRGTVLTRVPDVSHELYMLKDTNNTAVKTNKKDLSDDDANISEQALLCRATVPTEWTTEAFKPVRLSTFDKSPAIQFIPPPENNIVQGYKGYRMVRATSPVCEGDWYFEVKLLPYEGDGAVRLGWSQRRSDPETPVGFDIYGFGYRNRTGEFVHAARLKPYAQPFGQGDVIGCRIQLPNLTDEQKQRIKEADDKWLHHRFINLLQGQQPPDSGIDIHGSIFVHFYKNGTHLGIPAFFTEKDSKDSRSVRKAVIDKRPVMDKRPNPQLNVKTTSSTRRQVRAGHFYPSIALYGNAVAQANFGPTFSFPPPEGTRPMCEAARDAPPPKPVEHEKNDTTSAQHSAPLEKKPSLAEVTTANVESDEPVQEASNVQAAQEQLRAQPVQEQPKATNATETDNDNANCGHVAEIHDGDGGGGCGVGGNTNGDKDIQMSDEARGTIDSDCQQKKQPSANNDTPVKTNNDVSANELPPNAVMAEATKAGIVNMINK